MMTFEEWWWPRKPLGDELISGDVVTTAARAAWHAGFYQGRVHESGNNIARQIDADLSKLFIKAGNVPEGYVLVPVVPTAKMLSIGRKTVQEADIFEVYQAMIQAAQEDV